MNNIDPKEELEFAAMMNFFRKHHPPVDDDDVCADYLTKIREAFLNADNNLVSVAEFDRHRVTILGLEVIDYYRPLEVYRDANGEVLQVGYTGPVPTVRLPNGCAFDVTNAGDLAALRAKLKTHTEGFIGREEPGPPERNTDARPNRRSLFPW